MEDAAEKEPRNDVAANQALNIERHLADAPAGEPDFVGARQLRRDLGAGIAGAGQEHIACLQLRGIAIIARMQLPNCGIEVAREGGDARFLDNWRWRPG